MNKTLSLIIICLLSTLSYSAHAGVTVRYYNKDSNNYKWEAICSGSRSSVEFGSSRTSSTTIQGSGPCIVKTDKGEITLSGGDNIEIKNGKIQIK